MNYKKKSFIISIFLIISIQILLLTINKQKTSFRYLIWDIKEVSIGKLICFSFISGLLMSSILNKTLNNKVKTYSIKDDDSKKNYKNDNSTNNENINEYFDIPPERDIRDSQPTISVNYRVVKDNAENELKDRNKSSNNSEYQDDWNNKDADW